VKKTKNRQNDEKYGELLDTATFLLYNCLV